KVYYDSVKQAEAERQIRAEELMNEAKLNMGRGKYLDALPKLEEAKMLYPGDMAELDLIWARFTSEGRVNMTDLPVIDAFLKKVSQENRRSAVFYYVNGLYKRAAGDFKGAWDDFTRAIDMDGEMADARRDRAALKNQMPKQMNAKDILNGDISQVF